MRVLVALLSTAALASAFWAEPNAARVMRDAEVRVMLRVKDLRHAPVLTRVVMCGSVDREYRLWSVRGAAYTGCSSPGFASVELYDSRTGLWREGASPVSAWSFDVDFGKLGLPADRSPVVYVQVFARVTSSNGALDLGEKESTVRILALSPEQAARFQPASPPPAVVPVRRPNWALVFGATVGPFVALALGALVAAALVRKSRRRKGVDYATSTGIKWEGAVIEEQFLFTTREEEYRAPRSDTDRRRREAAAIAMEVGDVNRDEIDDF